MTDPSAPEQVFPLVLRSCRACRLTSLTHVIDAGDLYDQYYYVSSPSRTIQEHMEELAERFRRELALGPASFVVEIGSNNGDQLAKFEGSGCSLLGIDPARNITEQARARGIDTRTDFFTSDVAREVRGERGPADLILARHVVAHVDDVQDLVRGVRELLAPDGIFAFEVPYLVELMSRRAFDTVYHEHLSYFLVGTLRRLLERGGLRIVGVDRFEVHGGSIVVTATHADSARETDTECVESMLRLEETAGMGRDGTYDEFAAAVDGLRVSLRTSIEELVADGCVVAGYGASAKGVTLLTTSEIPASSLAYCTDTTPAKQGTLIPGLGVAVISPEEAAQRPPDVYVMLAWNYCAEILLKESDFLAKGGRFLVPIPEPRLVGEKESVELIGAEA
ncbi:novobiocin biosynthesis protein NovU/D-mycarose 3-C-methyltransferase [Nocardiopsis algeriensis]|uniref:Novobiocin biosynthesis protein NovU/D-mycarose 3-C-methyltransferase n=1 Tax=Nocardiopsis algeriensis TaxID=1478215 RepID=A0A841ITJ7_9ACTN|nr:novobiocin biosynthesis protein NovU/D-mycarose 3-C-methyltransferase [Nocardiopsis algeriensis]